MDTWIDTSSILRSIFGQASFTSCIDTTFPLQWWDLWFISSLFPVAWVIFLLSFNIISNSHEKIFGWGLESILIPLLLMDRWQKWYLFIHWSWLWHTFMDLEQSISKRNSKQRETDPGSIPHCGTPREQNSDTLHTQGAQSAWQILVNWALQAVFMYGSITPN